MVIWPFCWRLPCLSIDTIIVYFSIQRQASPLARGNYHGHPFSFFSRLLKSPLPSRDKWVHWHVETIMVIRFHCFQDYWSLPFHPETSGSVGTRRLSWSSIFIIFKTIEVSLAIQRQASPLAHGDHHGHPFSLFSRLLKSPLPSGDKQVRSHVETIMVSHFLSILKDCRSLCRDFIVSLCFLQDFHVFVDIPDASYALSFDRFHWLG